MKKRTIETKSLLQGYISGVLGAVDALDIITPEASIDDRSLEIQDGVFIFFSTLYCNGMKESVTVTLSKGGSYIELQDMTTSDLELVAENILDLVKGV